MRKLSSVSFSQEEFVAEKVQEHLQTLGFGNKKEDVTEISKTVLHDEQFWNLFNSLFTSYVMTYVEANRSVIMPKKEVL